MFTAGNDIGWHVFGECGSGFYHCHGSYSCSGVLDNARGEYRIVAYNAVAGNLGSVAEHAVIAHFSIVTNMCAFHEEVAGTDNGLCALVGCPVDNHVFAYDIIVAYDELAFFANEIKILW